MLGRGWSRGWGLGVRLWGAGRGCSLALIPTPGPCGCRVEPGLPGAHSIEQPGVTAEHSQVPPATLLCAGSSPLFSNPAAVRPSMHLSLHPFVRVSYSWNNTGEQKRGPKRARGGAAHPDGAGSPSPAPRQGCNSRWGHSNAVIPALALPGCTVPSGHRGKGTWLWSLREAVAEQSRVSGAPRGVGPDSLTS